MDTKSLVAMLVVLLASSSAPAAERKISLADLPSAVKRTIQENSAGAQIKGFTTEIERGQRVYEANLLAGGRTKDLQIDSHGVLREVEEEVPFEELPAAVQTALKQKAGGAQITKVESLTKQGRLVAYEAAVRRASHAGEIQVGPQGQPLLHQE